MLTFNQLYLESQEQAEDTSASSLTLIKRAINTGAKKFGAILNREWRNTSKTFSTAANQQYYQTPEDCIRIKSVTVTIGDVAYPLLEIADEDTWRVLNMRTQTSSTPECYYVRGNDEYGIWPTPSAAVADAGLLTYERRMRDMSQDDYITGTVTVTNASAAVVGVGTTFTALMVGRSLKLDDANGDGMWYKIASFTDATHITLENTYGGPTTSSAYAIGELPDIPEEFHESLIDYALYRYYLRRRDANLSQVSERSFEKALAECKADYSSKTASQYIRKPRLEQGYRHLNRDLSVM